MRPPRANSDSAEIRGKLQGVSPCGSSNLARHAPDSAGSRHPGPPCPGPDDGTVLACSNPWPRSRAGTRNTPPGQQPLSGGGGTLTPGGSTVPPSTRAHCRFALRRSALRRSAPARFGGLDRLLSEQQRRDRRDTSRQRSERGRDLPPRPALRCGCPDAPGNPRRTPPPYGRAPSPPVAVASAPGPDTSHSDHGRYCTLSDPCVRAVGWSGRGHVFSWSPRLWPLAS